MTVRRGMKLACVYFLSVSRRSWTSGLITGRRSTLTDFSRCPMMVFPRTRVDRRILVKPLDMV